MTRTIPLPNIICHHTGPGSLLEEEFFNHYKNDLKRHAHTPSGVAGADLKS